MPHALLFGGEVVIVQLAAPDQMRDSLVNRNAVCAQTSNFQWIVRHETHLVDSNAGEHLSAK